MRTNNPNNRESSSYTGWIIGGVIAIAAVIGIYSYSGSDTNVASNDTSNVAGSTGSATTGSSSAADTGPAGATSTSKSPTTTPAPGTPRR